MPNQKVYVNTNKICMHCGLPAILEVKSEEEAQKIVAWAAAAGGPGYIQDELKFLSNAQREMIISGTHPKCWDEIFADEED